MEPEAVVTRRRLRTGWRCQRANQLAVWGTA